MKVTIEANTWVWARLVMPLHLAAAIPANEARESWKDMSKTQLLSKSASPRPLSQSVTTTDCALLRSRLNARRSNQLMFEMSCFGS
ncbi:hypothetical protein N9L68_00445 [bacterium]|nr:hypothetical protein [bacterium]